METTLIKVDGTKNNNKFYKVTLEGDTVHTNWGRVGNTGQSGTSSGGEKKFHQIVKAKIRKGYHETGIVSSNAPATVNSGAEVKKAAVQSLVSGKSKVLMTLVDKLVAANAHSILEQSGGKIRIENGVARTPLGILSSASIKTAHKLLDDATTAKQQRKLERLAVEYASIVPQNIGMKRGWHETFFDKKGDKIASQRDLLEQLEASVEWFNSQTEATTTDIDYSDLFKLKISELKDKKEFARIEKLFAKTLNSRHSSQSQKLLRVYVVSDSNKPAFDAKAAEIGNVKENWHGTQIHNVLSILRKGLYVPPASARFVTGRMFGDGVYFSEQSTKSLNYSTGWWAGKRTSGTSFMFLADVAMGMEFRPQHHIKPAEFRDLYAGNKMFGRVRNSINVKGNGSLVRNHEAIVWNTDQINLKYLCEFG